jgi:TPR repeat protein
MTEPCCGSKEATKIGDETELDLAKAAHIPALLSVAKRHGPKRGLPQLEAVAVEGNAEACYRLYKHYRNKNQSSEELKKIRWLKAADGGGHTCAQVRLARLYREGE